ncbi:hypothetical protein [Haloquadratum walsbyi]|uniref:hypothetical protein n=1 Tax=Haloquadratum walsbyi TaxID=293091 RepID=UPI0026EE3423|nr:hypothetical protein [Haloquadratum walsbyi]
MHQFKNGDIKRVVEPVREQTIDGFTKREVDNAVDASTRTVHDVLKTMVQYGILTETNQRVRVPKSDGSTAIHGTVIYSVESPKQPNSADKTTSIETQTDDTGDTAEYNSNDIESTYTCNVCGDGFEDKHALTEHVKNSDNHPRVSQMDSCPKCGNEQILEVKRIDDNSPNNNETVLMVDHKTEMTEMAGVKTLDITNYCLVRGDYEA